jgi:hypothetical protein
MSANHPRFVRLGVAGFAAAMIALACYLALLASRERPASPPEQAATARSPETKQFPPPPLPASEYLNTAPDAKYVGSKVCAECHEREARTHASTAHSRALKDLDPASEPPDGSFFHAASGRHYRVYRQNGQFRHREAVLDENGDEIAAADYPVRYLVGSGHHTRSYLIDVDGFLSESPITWYASREAWEISPGYDRPNHRGFERAADASCLYCHVGRMKDPERQFYKLTFLEQAIGCERCHGAGSLHVERERSEKELADTPAKKTIVNPAKLSRQLSESICAHCHLMGDSLAIARGREITDFRPGLPLSSVVINYGLDAPHAEMKVVGHVSQMRASSCYQKSATLTCITCHAGHDEAPREEQRRSYVRICLDCHSDGETSQSAGSECRLERGERLRRNAANDCVACHMPQVETDVPHVAFTHHRIGIHEPQPTGDVAATSRQPPELAPLDDISGLPEIEQVRNLGMAYYGMSQRAGDPQSARYFQLRARQLLANVRKAGMRDSEITAALSRLYLMDGAAEEGVRLAREALRSEDLDSKARVNSLFAVALHGFETRQWSSAQIALDELVSLRRLAGDWDLRGVCRSQTGERQGALSDLQQAAAINPFLPGIRLNLAAVYEQLGDTDSAERERSIAASLSRRQSGR